MGSFLGPTLSVALGLGETWIMLFVDYKQSENAKKVRQNTTGIGPIILNPSDLNLMLS